MIKSVIGHLNKILWECLFFVSDVVLLLSVLPNCSQELIKKPRHRVYSSSRWSFFYNYILYQLHEYSLKLKSTYVAENMFRLQTSFVRSKCNYACTLFSIWLILSTVTGFLHKYMYHVQDSTGKPLHVVEKYGFFSVSQRHFVFLRYSLTYLLTNSEEILLNNIVTCKRF